MHSEEIMIDIAKAFSLEIWPNTIVQSIEAMLNVPVINIECKEAAKVIGLDPEKLEDYLAQGFMPDNVFIDYMTVATLGSILFKAYPDPVSSENKDQVALKILSIMRAICHNSVDESGRRCSLTVAELYFGIWSLLSIRYSDVKPGVALASLIRPPVDEQISESLSRVLRSNNMQGIIHDDSLTLISLGGDGTGFS